MNNSEKAVQVKLNSGKQRLTEILRLLAEQKMNTANAYAGARQAYGQGNQGVQQGYTNAMLAATQGGAATRGQLASIAPMGVGASSAAGLGGMPSRLGIIGDTSHILQRINSGLAGQMGQLGVEKGLAQAQGFGQIGGTFQQAAGEQADLTSAVANAIASVQRKPKSAGLGGVIGAVAPYAALALSARSAKTNIVPVGRSPSGIMEYEFAYKTNPLARYRGVMADEVEHLPGVVRGSYVDYSKIDVKMRRVG